jgi:RHS repeat-associated protein
MPQGSGTISTTYSYSPYGEMTSSYDKNNLAYTYNAEEYNPVTDMQYLRSRYYTPAAASFTTPDTNLGSTDNIASQNRYAYAQSDPVNNADPTGHTIGNSTYERQMEAAGGINEIYDFYVGTTLQNAYIRANNAFNARLNYAYGVDYRNQSAINSMHGISQATANAYIEYGREAALAIGGTYGCTPGTLTNQAINTFASDVDSARVRVNKKIVSV